jgi:replicative DNA helicase
MTQSIPATLANSVGLQYISSKGWNWQGGEDGQVKVEICPLCKAGNWHFYVAVSGNKDGLWFCHRCGETGNLQTLQEACGDKVPGVTSRKEWAGKERTPDALPDVNSCHMALLSDAEALDYLLNVRGFSAEIINELKLGVKEKVYFRQAGETKALVIPYLVTGNTVFVKYRTLPPSPKDFACPAGWDAPLYNGEILVDGLKEIIFVEGEADTISLMSNGVRNVVGVPGANTKKAVWIEALDRIAPEKIFIMYDNDKVGQRAAQEMASRIGIEKCWKITLPKEYKDINEFFQKGGSIEVFEKLKEAATLFDISGVTSSKDALEQLEDELNGKADLAPTYITQWPDLNRLVGFEDGDVIDIVAPEKVGKFLSVDSKVLTTKGWVRNGDLKVGDSLASVDGEPNVVMGVYPQGKQELFKVTFSDGRYTLAGAPHLWRIHGCTPWERGNDRVYTTDAIATEYCYPGTRRSQKVYIDLVSGDFGHNDILPIEPWLLGALIGDGGLSNGSPIITSADESIIQRVSMKVMGLGDTLKKADKHYSYRINGGVTKMLLGELGLWGHKAETKFIPNVYLTANKKSRWELLRGLMDTDGTAGNKYGTLSYCSVSKRLALDVQMLVRSLGGISKVGPPQKKQFRYKGELRTGQPAYIVSILLPEREKAFTLQRKLDRVKPRAYQPRLTFKSIESIGLGEALCIRVSHPSKMYITDDYIVTHNTTLGLNLLEHMVSAYGEDGLLICLEMTQARLARKWVSIVTGFEETLSAPGSEEAKVKKIELLDCIGKARAIQAGRTGDLYFAYPVLVKEPADIFKLIVDCVRRYGVKWVMFDNLQRLCDDTLKNQAHRTVHLSQISKGLTKIAKDYKIKLIRILQPKRIDKGSVISTNDVDGSSQVAKDCDAMLTMWRNATGSTKQSQYQADTQQPEEEQSFEALTWINVGLSRYSGGGRCKLYFDGGRSQVKNYEETVKKIDAQNAPKYNSIIATEAPVALAPLPQENISI